MEKDKQLEGYSFAFLETNSTVERDPAQFFLLQHIITKKPVNEEFLNRVLNFLLRNFGESCLRGEATSMYNDVLSIGGGVWRTLEAISAKDECRKAMSRWQDLPKLLESLNLHVVNDEARRQKVVSVLLSNLCIDQGMAEIICERHADWISCTLTNATNGMGTLDFEKAKDELYILQNVSQTKTGRRLILNALEERDPVCPFSVLYLDRTTPADFRESVFGLTKNLTFDYDRHEKFMDKGIIGPLLLPLVGSDVFSEEENDKMHPDWQYMDKEIEKSLGIKNLIIDTLLMLCNSKTVREKLRSMNVYLILREYHKVEENETIVEKLENVINILLRTEEEIGVEKLDLVYDFDKDIEKKAS